MCVVATRHTCPSGALDPHGLPQVRPAFSERFPGSSMGRILEILHMWFKKNGFRALMNILEKVNCVVKIRSSASLYCGLGHRNVWNTDGWRPLSFGEGSLKGFLDNWLLSCCLSLPVFSQGPWWSFREPGQGHWVLTECSPRVHGCHLKWRLEESHQALSCWLVAEEREHQHLERPGSAVDAVKEIPWPTDRWFPLIDWFVYWAVVWRRPTNEGLQCLDFFWSQSLDFFVSVIFMQAWVDPNQWGALKKLY